MQRGLLVAVLVLFPGTVARAQDVSEAEKKEGFVSLFNGKDFTGWRFGPKSAPAERLPANWKVEDGLIKLAGGGSPHLASQWDYEDFELRLEWRAVRANYNSGLYIRSRRNVGANQINLAKGAEGGLIGNQGAKGAKTVPKLQKPAMQWNKWRVRAIGDRVTFWCNGELAWEATNFNPPRGYLGLQAEGAPVEFRNLRIQELGYEPLADSKGWALDKAPGWKAEGDTLIADEKESFLSSARQDFKSYVLRLEYRGEKGSTGEIRLRSDKSNKAAVRIGEQRAGAGTLVGHEAKPKRVAENLTGAWNYLEVRLLGSKATVWLNGTVVVDSADLKAANLPDTGGIYLHAEGPMRFRNVRVREVKD